MPVELALTPDGRWAVTTPELVDAAHAAGFAAVGLTAGRADARAAEALASTGMRCHELLALMVGADRRATLESARQVAQAAGTVGAQWVLTVFRAGPSASTAVTVRAAAEIIAGAGAGMAVEFSPLGPVGDVAAGLDMVAAAGPDRAGLMIDSWHFCFGASTWEDLERVPLECIAYVQFADGLEPVSGNGMKETMDRRALPGEGILDLERFASTLLERGWDGLVSVEVLNHDLAQLPVPEFARMAYASTAGYWT